MTSLLGTGQIEITQMMIDCGQKFATVRAKCDTSSKGRVPRSERTAGNDIVYALEVHHFRENVTIGIDLLMLRRWRNRTSNGIESTER